LGATFEIVAIHISLVVHIICLVTDGDVELCVIVLGVFYCQINITTLIFLEGIVSALDRTMSVSR